VHFLLWGLHISPCIFCHFWQAVTRELEGETCVNFTTSCKWGCVIATYRFQLFIFFFRRGVNILKCEGECVFLHRSLRINGWLTQLIYQPFVRAFEETSMHVTMLSWRLPRTLTAPSTSMLSWILVRTVRGNAPSTWMCSWRLLRTW